MATLISTKSQASTVEPGLVRLATDAEALADVQNVSTDTKAEHIRRDVNITVEEINLGAGSQL